jgi:hypothetical protein
MILSWDRIPPLRRWNTSLSWIKSGEKSVVTDAPFEVYEKHYAPDLLPDNPALLELIVQDFASELQKILSSKRYKSHKDHYIQGKATAVVGRELEERAQARKAYSSGSGRTATVHTRRSPVLKIGQFVNDLREKLEHLAQLPSKPSWLIAVSVTLYLAEEDSPIIQRKGRPHIISA